MSKFRHQSDTDKAEPEIISGSPASGSNPDVAADIDEVASSHAKGEELSLEFATSITDVPYHPGAAKYFEEQGITVNTK